MPAAKAASSAADGLIAFEKFFADLREGKRFDVLLLTGTEQYLLRNARDAYLRTCVNPDFADFDLTELRGADVDAAGLWDILTTLPFGSGRRTVVIDNPSEIKRKDIIEVLTKYFERPSSRTSLLLVEPQEDYRERIPSWLAKNIPTIEFPLLRSAALSRWVQSYVKEHGKTISSNAVSHLLESSQPTLSDLVTKLDHAILYIGNEPEITVAELMKVAGVSSTFDAFQLEDSLLKGHTQNALDIARSLIEGGEALLMLLARARSLTLKTWQVSGAIGRSDASSLLEMALGRQIFKKNDFMIAAKRLGSHETQERLMELLDLEIHIKSKTSDPLPLYYRWIWNFSSSKS